MMHIKSTNVWIGAKIMSVNKDETFNILIAFIIEEIPWINKKNIDEQTDLVDDIGLYGDDCIEFLKKFCQRFNIKCSKLDFSKCGKEGIDPVVGMILWVLSIFNRKETKQKNGYKISELMKLIEAKRVR